MVSSAPSEDAQRALYDAVLSLDEWAIRDAVVGGADPGVRCAAYDESPLHAAVCAGQSAIVRQLCALTDISQPMLMAAARRAVIHGEDAVLEQILEGPLHPLREQPPGTYTLLELAVREPGARVSTVEILLREGEDPFIEGAHGTSPLHTALTSSVDKARVLLAAMGSIGLGETASNGLPAIFRAADHSPEMIDFVVAHGGDVNTPSERWPYLPLRAAIQSRRLDNVRRLLEHRADPNGQSPASDGVRPLHHAAAMRSPAILRELLRYGTDVNAATNGRGPVTPLEIAICEDDDRSANLLLRMGANPDGVDGAASTPLLRAIDARSWRGEAMVTRLLMLGADPYRPDVEAQTPLEAARSMRDASADGTSGHGLAERMLRQLEAAASLDTDDDPSATPRDR